MGDIRYRWGLTLVFAPLAVAVASLFCISAEAQQFSVPTEAERRILEATNAHRVKAGLSPLRLSRGASKVAENYARYLAKTGKTGHRADGRSPRDRLEAGGMPVCRVWENWYKSWTSRTRPTVEEATDKAMAFWRNSPGHERSLRSPSSEIGVGVVGWKRGRHWVYVGVQLFLDRSCL